MCSNNDPDDDDAAMFAKGTPTHRRGAACPPSATSLKRCPPPWRAGTTRCAGPFRNNKHAVSVNAGIVALKGALRKLELNGNGDMLWKPTAPPVPAPHFEDANIITALFQLFRKEQRPY